MKAIDDGLLYSELHFSDEDCDVLGTKTHSQARDINMYNFIYRTFQTTILHPEHVSAFCFQPEPSKLVLAHVLFSRNVGGLDSRKPSSPTFSGSNTIRFWSPTSSTDAGTTFSTGPVLKPPLQTTALLHYAMHYCIKTMWIEFGPR
ncbi:hypothetical protein TNCV_1640151 [Trichonephila clavipes]|nr:hypothetical protein TNCV_1640151 [Trichonephila clavipes]